MEELGESLNLVQWTKKSFNQKKNDQEFMKLYTISGKKSGRRGMKI